MIQSVTRYLSPATRYLSPATRHPSPATRHPPPTTRHPLPATRHPLTVTRYPPPATRHPWKSAAVTQIPNTSSSARFSSPPSPIHAFLTRQTPLFAVFLVLTRSPNLRTKTTCRELIPEAFKRDFVLTIGRRGKYFVKTFFVKKPVW